jgi:two-component system phosphate regulon sensor histidine kinase PhoR
LESVRDPIVEQTVAETLRTGEPVRNELAISNRQMQMSGVPIKNDLGRTTGAIFLLHDITELKRADEIRRDFVANVSHELRTPLSILRGYIETLRDDPEIPADESSRILEVMDRHSKRLGQLVDDLLTLAKLESGKSNLQLSEIDLPRLFADVTRDWEKKISEKKIKATVDLPANLPTLYADEGRLQEVLYNLIDNAVKYAPEHGRICLSAAQRDHEIVLSVSDNGIGIASDDLPRIFERFYRVDKARSRALGGTGLGLSIVKHIAQLHGGRVEAESTNGKGTTIRVVLPVRSSG